VSAAPGSSRSRSVKSGKAAGLSRIKVASSRAAMVRPKIASRLGGANRGVQRLFAARTLRINPMHPLNRAEHGIVVEHVIMSTAPPSDLEDAPRRLIRDIRQ